MFTIKSNLTGLVIAAALSMASLFLADASVAAEPNQASSQQEAIGSAALSNRG